MGLCEQSSIIKAMIINKNFKTKEFYNVNQIGHKMTLIATSSERTY